MVPLDPSTPDPQGDAPNPSETNPSDPSQSLTTPSEPSEPNPNADNTFEQNPTPTEPTSLNTKRPFSTARMYRAAGWLGTLPLPQGKKNPPPKGFTGGGRPHPSTKQVENWAAENPSGNIALRLAEVPHEHLPKKLPPVYAGHQVVGWELVGIDIDDYRSKNGGKQRAELEAEFGELPATALSSARWGSGHASCIAVYLVPKGYRFMGKAKDCIDIVQKRHRYMVVWPSVNPDAKAMYEWRIGKPSDADDLNPPREPGLNSDEAAASNGGGTLTLTATGIPALASVAVLPEPWFDYLSRGGENETDDPISTLCDDDLLEWAATELRWGNGEPDCAEYPPCRFAVRQLNAQIEKLNESAESHPKLTAAVWELLKLGTEGHRGIHWALAEYVAAWKKHAMEERDGVEPNALSAEVGRSIRNALSKLEPVFTVLPEEPCDTYDKAHGKATRRQEADGDEDSDYGGLGPIIGPMEVLPARPPEDYGQHDVGNAEHLIDLYGDNIKFVGGRNNWVVWDGYRWHDDKGDRLIGHAYSRVRYNQEALAENIALEAMEAAARDDPDAKALKAAARSWHNWARSSGDNGRIKSATQCATRLYFNGEPVVMNANMFDSRPDLLGCANGVLELTDDPFVRPPRKEDYVTFNTGVPYKDWERLIKGTGVDEDHQALVLWNKYLTTFLPDESVRRYTQKVLGHMLIGGNPEKLLVFLYGTHDTGKSTILNAIKGALGDYFGTVDLALFKQRDLNPGLIQAVPRRVVGMSEIDNGKMDVATVKRLTGNDPVRAEAKYSNEIFEGKPQFTIVISCNNPPNIDHADEALNERLMVLPFGQSIARDSRDYAAADNIEKHCGVAVLSWLVEGWKMYCVEGLGERPEIVSRVKQEMFTGLNDTRSFMNECLELATDSPEGMRVEAAARARVLAGERLSVKHWDKNWTPIAANVYQLYVNWCTANRVLPVSHPQLTKELGLGRPMPRKVDGKVQRCYMGARIK